MREEWKQKRWGLNLSRSNERASNAMGVIKSGRGPMAVAAHGLALRRAGQTRRRCR
jgi:hypothetical protein